VSTDGKFVFALSLIALIKLTEILTRNSHVFEVNIPERIEDKEAFKAFIEAMGNNKPRKGKKGKGKGKGKGKKKK
jgi:hypothetical protein